MYYSIFMSVGKAHIYVIEFCAIFLQLRFLAMQWNLIKENFWFRDQNLRAKICCFFENLPVNCITFSGLLCADTFLYEKWILELKKCTEGMNFLQFQSFNCKNYHVGLSNHKSFGHTWGKKESTEGPLGYSYNLGLFPPIVFNGYFSQNWAVFLIIRKNQWLVVKIELQNVTSLIWEIN